MRFATVTVVGVGLIGGSIAAAAKLSPGAPKVRGVDTDAEALDFAVKNGIIDEAFAPQEALEAGWFEGNGDALVVLATPIDDTLWWIERLGQTGFQGVVTDAVSTKAAIVEAAREHLSEKVSFIGGHPMAGSDRSGVTAATPELFKGAYYVLTPAEDSDMNSFRRVHTFVTDLGARVISIDAADHDEAVAIISHVPHMAAAALTNLAARGAGERDVLRLAAGGFKDMTRIAAGSPRLWTGISLDNKAEILKGIDEYVSVLMEYRTLLQSEETVAIESWLEEAAAVRRALPAQWVPATTALTELTIPVRDRPGVISEVTTAIGRARCNIEDIEIDHQTEDSAMLRLVLTDEGDFAALEKDLLERGYELELRPLEDE